MSDVHLERYENGRRKEGRMHRSSSVDGRTEGKKEGMEE
jgi:hypothetical protein